MKIRNLIEPGRVLTNVKARSKKHALEILAELLASGAPETTQADILERLVGRERLGCTAIGEGVAMPHGRLPEISENIGAFLRLAEAVDFDAEGEEPVDLLFGLLIPEESGDAHLESLAKVAKMLSEPKFGALLRQATSSRALYDLLVDFDLEHQASA